MAFTRFNYDQLRTDKYLQQSTDPGRYMLDVPGWGNKPYFINDPQIRMQKWGGNLRKTNNNNSIIDINSDLIGLNNINSKCDKKKKYKDTHKINYPIYSKTFTNETRVTHPSWMYRDLKQDHTSILLFDPLKNIYDPLKNNINTRNLERDNFVA